MDVRAQISYPAGSPDEVYAMAVDRDFRAAVCVATGALEHRVDIAEGPDGRVRVTVERTVPAAVPDIVRSFVGETLTIVQTDVWGMPSPDGSRVADLRISVKGQPAQLTGTQTLQPVGVKVVADAALFAAAGIPTVYHGPVGSGAHADVEYMTVDELVRAAKVYVALLRRLLT